MLKIELKYGRPHTRRTGKFEDDARAYLLAVAAMPILASVPLPKTVELQPASWNSFQVTINPSSAEDVRYIRIDFTTGTTFLGQ